MRKSLSVAIQQPVHALLLFVPIPMRCRAVTHVNGTAPPPDRDSRLITELCMTCLPPSNSEPGTVCMQWPSLKFAGKGFINNIVESRCIRLSAMAWMWFVVEGEHILSEVIETLPGVSTIIRQTI